MQWCCLVRLRFDPNKVVRGGWQRDRFRLHIPLYTEAGSCASCTACTGGQSGRSSSCSHCSSCTQSCTGTSTPAKNQITRALTDDATKYSPDGHKLAHPSSMYGWNVRQHCQLSGHMFCVCYRLLFCRVSLVVHWYSALECVDETRRNSCLQFNARRTCRVDISFSFLCAQTSLL